MGEGEGNTGMIDTGPGLGGMPATSGIIRHVLKYDGCKIAWGDGVRKCCDTTEKAYAVGADEGELSGRDCS